MGGGFGGGHIGGFGGGHTGSFGGGQMGGLGGGHMGGFGGSHVAGMSHDHFGAGRGRFRGMYDYGLDCPYYRTITPPYNCIY